MSDENGTYYDVLQEILMSNYDVNTTANEKYAVQMQDVRAQFVVRNKELTKLLIEYIDQRQSRVETNRKLKLGLYWTFILLFLILTCCVSCIFLKADIKSATINSTVSLLSVSATYVSSILAIIKIMCKYLFPADEEKDTIRMIQTVINNDLKVEEVTSKAINDNDHSFLEHLGELKKLVDSGAITNDEFETLKTFSINKFKE